VPSGFEVLLATTVTIAGVSYLIPNTGDSSWGDNVTNWIVASSSKLLQKSGGTFTLTAEVDFGATWGLKSAYFKSRGTNPATTGVGRMANNEGIAWRDAANAANKTLKVNASDRLEYDGDEVLTSVASLTASRALVSDSGGSISSSSVTSTELGRLSGILSSAVGITDTQTLTNKSLKADTNRLVDGTDTTKKVAFDLSGLTTGNTRTLTVPDSNLTLVGTILTQTLTNKSLSDTTSGFVNASDATKAMKVDLSGATTGKTATLAFPVTNNRTITFPDATGTLATVFSQSTVIVDTGNGYGSTNTKIRRFTNSTTVGSDITYADSATNGGSFTINTAGIYQVTYVDFPATTTQGDVGISVNSNQLTTAIGSITKANRLAHGTTNNGGAVCVSVVWTFSVNDIIRAHTDGAVAGTGAGIQLRITRIV
jgi:hypothetical protein